MKTLFENLRTNKTIQTLSIEAKTHCTELKEFQEGIISCLRENTTLSELNLHVIFFCFCFFTVSISQQTHKHIEDLPSIASGLEGNSTLKKLELFVSAFELT